MMGAAARRWTPEELDEAARQLCQNDLRFLCREILGMKDWDGFHDEIAAQLKASDKDFDLYLLPREHLKTSIITVGYSIQRILNDPNITILLTSAVLGNSISFLAEIRDYLTSKSELPRLFGRFESTVWNTEQITVGQRKSANKTPTISTGGSDKTAVSQHYDLIIGDDLVNRQTVNTPEQIGKTRRYYSDLLDLRMKPSGKLILIGTRWDDKDLYGQIQKEEAALPESGRPKTFNVMVRKAVEDGRVIFPKKFTPEILADLKAKKGTYDYSCQYMNEPVSRNDQHFKPPVRYWTEIPKDAPRAVTVDLSPSDEVDAAEEGREPDFNVVTDSAFSKANQLHVCGYSRGHFEPSQVIDHIFHKVLAIMTAHAEGLAGPLVGVGIESVAYQRVFLHLLEQEMTRRNVYFPVYKITPHKDKFFRIMALQPLWENKDLLLKPGMVELDEEFDRFPRAEHDDILDTLAMAQHMFDATAPKNVVVNKQREELRKTDPASAREWDKVDREMANKKKAPAFKMARIGRV